MKDIEIRKGDCLELMKDIKAKSIDMILCDLPYGTTACKWDVIIPFNKLWEQYERIIKDNGAIVLTASQPFTSTLVLSNIRLFSHTWVWEKEQGVNFMLSNKQPLKVHEDIVVFSKKQPVYNPVMTYSSSYKSGKGTSGDVTGNVNKTQKKSSGARFPKSIIKINRETGLHPTQKPIPLFEYLIKTYSNEGDLILDNCAGSGTTGVACINLNRRCILMEQEDKYINIIKQRLKKVNNKKLKEWF